MKTLEKHIVPQQEQPLRLQDYGSGIFTPYQTRSAFRKAIKKKLILTNGEVATTATLISGGEVIELLQEEEAPQPKELILSLDVVFEDEYLAVINKPAGLAVSGNRFRTLDRALPQNLNPSNQPDATRPRPVHRLDHPTTGLVLVGKTSSSIVALNRLFEDREVTKTYYAIAIGLLEERGTIDLPIDEKPATTHFEVINTIASPRFQQLSLVKLRPATGRKHQIRKHLQALGTPILGDREYGHEPLILKGKGLYLHAFSLEFTHPFTGESMCIEQALQEKFTRIFGPD